MTLPQPTIPLFRIFMADSALAAAGEVLHSGQITAGATAQRFELAAAAVVGHPNVVAMSDQSAALMLGLYLAGVRPGDEVIVSPMACLATSMPIANLFASPVWCDVDPLTGMMDPERIAELVNERTRAILVYHWSGDVAEIEALANVARRYDLPLVQDASAALGAEINGRRLGASFADYSIFSFYPTKHITCGEGSVLVVNDEGRLSRARQLRRYGIDATTFRLPDGDLNPESDIVEPGFNFPMTNLSAAIGLENLAHLERLLPIYRDNGAYFDRELAGVAGVKILKRRPDTQSGFWSYSLRVEQRSQLVRKLKAAGIGCQRLHLRNDRYTCFASRRKDLPGTDIFDAENLSIPCGWWVSVDDRERIVRCIREGW